MDWSNPAVQWTASALITILAGSFAAFWTYRLGTRQKYWEKIVEIKRARMDDFLDATRDYVGVLHHVSNLHLTSKIEKPNHRMSNLSIIVQRLIPSADDPGRRALSFMEQNIVPDYLPHPENEGETDARCKALVTGLHNHLVSRLVAAANNVQNKYARLSMVCYDPGRPGVLKKHIIGLTRQIISHPPPTRKIQFDQVFDEWVDISGHVTVYLRLDLDSSLRSFTKAKKLKPAWRKKHKPLSLVP